MRGLHSSYSFFTLPVLLIPLFLLISGCKERVSEIKVSDFGAIPDDGKDDAPGILSAINSADGITKTIPVFDKGRYDIYGSAMDDSGHFKPGIEILNKNELTIDGNGSELTGHADPASSR